MNKDEFAIQLNSKGNGNAQIANVIDSSIIINNYNRNFSNGTSDELLEIAPVQYSNADMPIIYYYNEAIVSQVVASLGHVSDSKLGIDTKSIQQTFESLKQCSVGTANFPSNGNCTYIYRGEVNLSRKFVAQSKKFLIRANLKIKDYKLFGDISADKWLSQSVLNVMLVEKKVKLTIIFQRLKDDKSNNQPIQFLYIAGWKE
ncbi:hypothetical protein FACS1894188_12540 [Clostridia bacterium]|nr:hypothetical protein FACS1894188_12540 [Clostridia bacterium]